MRATAFLSAFSIVLSCVTGAIANDEGNDAKSYGATLEIRGNGKVPLCDNAEILNKITKRFHKTNLKYRDNDLAFESVDYVRETDYISNPSDEIDRRFCVADVDLNDGTQSTVYYLILERNGVASIGPGVDLCVIGHDPERAHGDECRSVKAPF